MKFDPARTAVLAMDCQVGIVSIYAKPPEEFLGRAASVLAAARKAGWKFSGGRDWCDGCVDSGEAA